MIGHPDHVFSRIERNGAQYRAKDFLLLHAHVRGGAQQDRRGIEISGIAQSNTAYRHIRARTTSGLNIGADTVTLIGRN